MPVVPPPSGPPAAEKPDTTRPAVKPAQFGTAAETKESTPRSSAAATASVATEPPKKQDMAERYFPQEDERMGTRASDIALAAMLLLLFGAIHAILMSRDVH
jgi:hypothetical protein